MMLRVQQERMTAAYFPTVREYRRRYGLDAGRMALLPEHAIVMHPGPMNRGVEIAAEVADSARSTIVAQVANGVTVRMAVLYLMLGGAAEEAAVTTRHERAPKCADPATEPAPPISGGAARTGAADERAMADQGRVVLAASRRTSTSGTALSPRSAPAWPRRARASSTPPAWSRCPASSTCTRTCASRAGRTPRPSRPAPGPPRSAATRRCTRWPTPSRSPTRPAWWSRSGGSASRPGTSTSARSARSPSAWPASSSPSSARWPTPPPGSASSPTTASASPTRC